MGNKDKLRKLKQQRAKIISLFKEKKILSTEATKRLREIYNQEVSLKRQ